MLLEDADGCPDGTAEVVAASAVGDDVALALILLRGEMEAH